MQALQVSQSSYTGKQLGRTREDVRIYLKTSCRIEDDPCCISFCIKEMRCRFCLGVAVQVSFGTCISIGGVSFCTDKGVILGLREALRANFFLPPSLAAGSCREVNLGECKESQKVLHFGMVLAGIQVVECNGRETEGRTGTVGLRAYAAKSQQDRRARRRTHICRQNRIAWSWC